MMTVNNKVYTSIADYVMTGGIVEISLDTHTWSSEPSKEGN